ncbi:Het-C domain-containing protein [Streptomyces sp. GS7]|uniref:Het-C domain-containing protein n=1 Tax=Streptomyces sp. GS7 TaxID=2692234 RepID=UPI001F3696BB|nr:Het-C domain-containing protein [Streptomyces sp. GS7]
MVTPALLLATAGPADAFGTVNAFGQHAEHERITRAALACAPGIPSDGSCFEPRSLDQLAGHRWTFGAVGAPDSDETLDSSAHCDNADYLDARGYPRSRRQATEALRGCIAHLQARFRQGVAAARRTLDARGRVTASETRLRSDCTFTLGLGGRAKCEAVEGFGRALHGVQDFYAHSNWTDRSDPSRPVSLVNPPGLGRSAPSPLLDLAAPRPPRPWAIPRNLTTGCFSLLVGACSQRITHADLNKDEGSIDPVSGATSAPGTVRGQAAGNFGRAVQGAITESRRQWREFRTALLQRYGRQRGARLVCVITHDDPVRDCA